MIYRHHMIIHVCPLCRIDHHLYFYEAHWQVAFLYSRIQNHITSYSQDLPVRENNLPPIPSPPPKKKT